MRAKSLQLCLTLCNPMGGRPPGSSVHRILQQEYWSELPLPPAGHLSDPRMERASLTSPALAGEFFNASATWEALTLPYYLKKPRERSLVVWKVLGKEKGRNKILLAAASLGDAEREHQSRGCAKPDTLNVQVTQAAGIGHDGECHGRERIPPGIPAHRFRCCFTQPCSNPKSKDFIIIFFFLPERDAHSLGLPTVHRASPSPRARPAARLVLTPHRRGTRITIIWEN